MHTTTINAFAATQAAVEVARQAFDNLPPGRSEEQNRPLHECLADAEDAAVADLIATPARSEDELHFKLERLSEVIENGVWSDHREFHLAASIALDAQALGLIPQRLRDAA